MAEETKHGAGRNSVRSPRARLSKTEAMTSDPGSSESRPEARAEIPAAAESPASSKPRFHFFIIDSGWDSAAARVIRENIDMITRFQNDDPLFVLTQEQSTALMRRHPHLIGKDPILLARDLDARGGKGGSEYHGFHLNMGLIKEPAKAVANLRKFLQFLAIHRHSADIEKDVREQLHREGLQGAIEVLRVGSETLAG